MKIKINFSYTESIVPPKCRNARPVTFHDGVLNASIKEVTGAEAPVAIIAEKAMTDELSPAFKVEYRWHDGKLWTAVRMRCGSELCSYTSGKQDWQHPELPDAIDMTVEVSLNGAGRLLGIYNYRYFHQPKAAVVKELHKAIKDHLIIDGVFYRPEGEPRYVVMTFGFGNNHGGTSVSIDGGYNSNISKSRYFSLLERDKAIALGTQIATNRGDNESLPMRIYGPTYQILIPEAIRVEPNKQHGDGCPLLNQFDAVSQASGGSPAVGLAVAMLAISTAG